MLRLAVLLAAFLSGAATQAVAAEPKPAISIKTKAAEISVSIDDAIKTNRELSANLLTEGKSWSAKQSKDASTELKSSPDMFTEGRKWTLERNYSVTSTIAGRYVSVLRNDYSFTGGAHPNINMDTILWDAQAKKRISIRPFFTDLSDDSAALTDIRKGIIESLIVEKKERGTYDENDMGWAKGVEPSLLKIGAVTLEPSTGKDKSSGLTFNYSHYAVGSYAEGLYSAFVPWRAFAAHLSPEGKAIFGGEKPPEVETKEKNK